MVGFNDLRKRIYKMSDQFEKGKKNYSEVLLGYYSNLKNVDVSTFILSLECFIL
jgi:hypothetical protein